MDYKLYILSFDATLAPKWWLTHPFDSLIKFGIKLFTWSNINHVAHNYNYARCGKLINQSIPGGYESIDHMECFKNRDTTVRAYEVEVPIDFKRVHEYTKSLRGRPYDKKGAVYSDVHKIPILERIFRRKANDVTPFCSESVIEVLKNEGHLWNIENENTITPKALIKILRKHDLCKPPIIVWQDSKLINNIFN